MKKQQQKNGRGEAVSRSV